MPNDPQEWVLLIEAYIWSDDYEEAYNVFQKAVAHFPNEWELYIYGGVACSSLEKYDEAFKLWDKAGELGTDFFDEYYCKAICYRDIGEYEKAYNIYSELSEKLRQNNYDEEAEMAEREAEKTKLKSMS